MFIAFIVGIMSVILYLQNLRITKLEKDVANIMTIISEPQIKFFINKNGQKIEVTQMFLKVSDQLPVSIAIKDKFGNNASVEGAPAWALTDSSLGNLAVADGGMSAVFTPAGQVGTLKVQVSADADLGEGVKTILGELEIELLAGEAVSVEVSAGEATPAP
jgi:hypothetical protein